jgi:hypothetical protein
MNQGQAEKAPARRLLKGEREPVFMHASRRTQASDRLENKKSQQDAPALSLTYPAVSRIILDQNR